MSFQSWFYKNFVYLPVATVQAGPVTRYQRELEAGERAPVADRSRRQIHALRQLVAHARTHVPFYAQSLAGIDPATIVAADDILQLPTLSKADLQQHRDELRTRAPVGRLIPKTTGGSTGEPVTVFKTRIALARELAATWRGYGWAGVGMGDRQARFWGVPYQQSSRWRAQLIDTVCNRIRLSAFRFGEEDLAAYLDLIGRARPAYFYGYVSMLNEFAAFLRRNNLSLPVPLKCVITTSEVLTDPVRRGLREAFGAPVFDEYGCGELGTIAHECPAGSLHLSEENMFVEILDGDRPCPPGQPGEIVVTELNNLGMPLIRYRTGDFGTLTPDPCDCGRTLRVLESVHGRAYDFVVGSAGRRFHGEFIMYVFEEIRRDGPGIRQFQCVQKSPDSFLIRIVREAGYGPEHETLISSRLRDHVHESARIEFEYVDEILRERSGKMRLIVGIPAETGGKNGS